MTNSLRNSALNVRSFLLTHSLAELERMHGVYARWSQDGRKFSLNYDQIEATDSDVIAQECRGLILRPLNLVDSKSADRTQINIGATEVLARPMHRFFNLGQGSAESLDFSDSSTRILEKLDGTLCIVYEDDGKWCVATRSVPEADLPVDGFGDHTFRSLFIAAIESCSGNSWSDITKILSSRGKGRTFCFELMTPYNTVVVRHENMRVALLAVINNQTGEEDHRDMLDSFWCDSEILNLEPVKSYPLRTIEDITTFVNGRSGMDYEGVVATQYLSGGLVKRVKIKSAAYLLASRTKSIIGASPRNMMELILLEQVDDLLGVMTEDQKAKVEEMQANLRNFIHSFDGVYRQKMEELESLGPMSDHLRRKTFARAVGGSEMWMAPAMAMYEGKAHGLHEWILKHKERTNDKRFPSGFLDTLVKTVQVAAKTVR